MPVIIAYLVKKFSVDTVKRAIMITMITAQIVGMAAFYVSLATILVTIFQLITTLMNTLDNYSSFAPSDSICFVTQFGLLSAINGYLALVTPPVFLFFAIVANSYMLRARRSLYEYLRDLTRLI